ncbi:hypothetical protein K3181_11350 [Qipengyuania sp. YG27]|uniref:RcnB family protein n=1 Tax=Qipengyuania mesophila TaxID=2867246 RepID=A0ABS7JWW5_9SPHN|nr:hypothetical protein [Qipengyuania mesophila]MBX7502038.1 hypothetical protein [Qipengyuania mesophila]
MRILVAGAAAVALAAAGANAEPGKGKGNEHGGKPHAAAQSAKDRGNGGAKRAQSHERHSSGSKPHPASQKREEFRGNGRTSARGDDQRSARPAGREDRSKQAPRTRVERYGVERIRDREFLVRDRSRGLIAGCPPGLARKNNGCLPPGQAKKRSIRSTGWNGYTYRPRLFGLTNYAPGPYEYAGGYLLRALNDGSISGYIPLLGGALAIGNTWPSTYQSYALPDYYVDYYDLGPSNSYRYADNVIYRVDPEDAAIASVAALLTGDEFVVGQPMPQGYDVYNVPYSYRDRYRDTQDAWYRYSDGYVYRVDPTTQLVAAAIDLLV